MQTTRLGSGWRQPQLPAKLVPQSSRCNITSKMATISTRQYRSRKRAADRVAIAAALYSMTVLGIQSDAGQQSGPFRPYVACWGYYDAASQGTPYSRLASLEEEAKAVNTKVDEVFDRWDDNATNKVLMVRWTGLDKHLDWLSKMLHQVTEAGSPELDTRLRKLDDDARRVYAQLNIAFDAWEACPTSKKYKARCISLQHRLETLDEMRYQAALGQTDPELLSRLTQLEEEAVRSKLKATQLEADTERAILKTKQLEEALERSKLSVSNEADVGVYFLSEGKSALVEPLRIINNLGVTVDMAKYVKALNADKTVADRFKAAQKSMEEAVTQEAYEKLAAIAHAQQPPPGLHAIGTSDYGFPGKEKMDLLVSAVPKPKKSEGKVAWTQVAGLGELKSRVGMESPYHIVLGQTSNRIQDLFKHQPLRSMAFAVVGGIDYVELIQAFRDGRPALRTGRLSLTLDESSPGLQLLAAFFTASKIQLDYKEPFLLPEFSVPALSRAVQDGGRGPWLVKSRVALWDTSSSGRQTGSTVSECSYTSAVSQEVVQAVLKCSSAAKEEAETLLLLNQAHVPYVPQLLDVGELKINGAPYLAITPMGQEVSFDETAEVILRIGLGVATALVAMYNKCKTLHLDLSPDNILIGPDGSALLIDFHLSHRSRFPKVLSGTVAYMACSRLATGKPTLSSELESLMYVLLYWACHGHLPWKRAQVTGNRALMRYTKLGCMREDFEEKIMERCRPDLRPAMQALRDLFFKPSYCETVQPQAFLDVLNKHLLLL